MKRIFIIFKILFCLFVVLFMIIIYNNVKEIKNNSIRSERFIENSSKYVDVVDGRKLIDPDEYIKKIQEKK
jgi:hypothetical protein